MSTYPVKELIAEEKGRSYEELDRMGMLVTE